MPAHQGIAGLTLHLFTRKEAVHLLQGEGFHVVAIRPVGLEPNGNLAHPNWMTGLRAYGYLLAARRP
jgi:hypothetical protein